MCKLKVSDELIIKSYHRTQSVWKTGLEVGLCGQSVHERLIKLGINMAKNKWTEQQIKFLKDNYEKYALTNNLDKLAKYLGRHKTNICRKAKSLGLTDIKRPKSNKTKKKFSIIKKQWMTENQHPKGMLGKKHSQETLNIISEKTREMFTHFTKKQLALFSIKKLKSKYENGNYNPIRKNVTWKGGERVINGKTYKFHSRWEANFARYLDILKSLHIIFEWEYEPDIFWFNAELTPPYSYLPDFKIFTSFENFYYYEVKGWLDDNGKSKLELMNKYYPEIQVHILDKTLYIKLEKKYSVVIPSWEF